MFIRVKKVKKGDEIYEYAHLVSGVWKRKKLKNFEMGRKFVKFNNSVHNYGDFLGRVYRLQEVERNVELKNYLGDFKEFVNNKDVKGIYGELIGYELYCRGFNKIHGVFVRNNLHVDLKRKVVHDGSKDVVIKMKDFSGYLCSLTLENLFQINKIQNRYDGIYLVKKLRSIGIELSPDNFYILADKLLKQN